MADTNLTNLIVNSLTREEYHNADLTDHQDELFVQSDHAGVHIGSVGVDGLDTTNITNCITEIPQDIKLELNAGTLTLKAGSKCYLKTDTTTPSVTVVSDLTTTQTTNGTYFAIYNGSVLTTVLTTTYDYSSLPNTYSLPLAVITISGGAITSIDQVFNGFGYIGSTVFALPWVKGLIPNSFNADGTLKNTTWTCSSVITRTFGSETRDVELGFDGSSFSRLILSKRSIYDRFANVNLNLADNPPSKWIYTSLATCTLTAGVISNFNIKTTFHALDYNDGEFIAHQAMPSNKYVDLTLPASGNSIIAPADGYVVLVRNTATTYSSITLQNTTSGIRTSTWWNAAGTYIAAYVPVSKSDDVLCQYTSSDSTIRFRFVYANGAK